MTYMTLSTWLSEVALEVVQIVAVAVAQADSGQMSEA